MISAAGQNHETDFTSTLDLACIANVRPIRFYLPFHPGYIETFNVFERVPYMAESIS